uniref:Clathrin interactor EPSIN 1 n=2 Tax=Anthurium amnicola TaxID=1678845 RepID=A0A1D1YJL2_9ARAE
MDFMKVLDQAVREIKREVNLKVLKVPEIEQKVLDATNNEPWGPHGSALIEISQASKKFTECQIVMNVLWTRLTDTGPNWRHVYKALSVIEYLVANGSERAVDDILEHTFQISSLSSFEYVEPNGKDAGLNVRKKVETILALLNDNEKIQTVRNKAATNRDKYFGLSSTGVAHKSSSASYGSNSFQKRDKYGGLSGAKEDETFKDSYTDKDQFGDEIDWKSGKKDDHDKSSATDGTKLKKGTTRLSSALNPSVKNNTSNSSSAQIKIDVDDVDDFDPRQSSTSKSSTTSFKQVDLLGDSLIGDLLDAPTSVSREATNSNSSEKEVDLFADSSFVSAAPHTATSNSLSRETTDSKSSTDEVDLFAEATFVSATPHTATSTGYNVQGQIDLFADQPSSLSNIDLLATPDSGVSTGVKSHTPVSSSRSSFDPFVAVPQNTSELSDLFGAFSSHADSASPEQLQNSGNDSLGNLNKSTLLSSKPEPKKETFQVRSGIWADSLSRGLIDLNLTASKKVSLSDIGVVGGLTDGSDEKETRHPSSVYTGRGIGSGSGPGKSGFPY